MNEIKDTNNFVIDKEIKRFSKKYHKDEDQILKEALVVYGDYMDLLSEFDMWDKVSDNDFVKFEKSLS